MPSNERLVPQYLSRFFTIKETHWFFDINVFASIFFNSTVSPGFIFFWMFNFFADCLYINFPFYDEKKKIESNFSFDLCRLGCSIYDIILDKSYRMEYFEKEVNISFFTFLKFVIIILSWYYILCGCTICKIKLIGVWCLRIQRRYND